MTVEQAQTITEERTLHAHTPICGRCATNMVPKRNGVTVRLTNDALVDGDLMECPLCFTRVVVGFASERIERHGRHSEMFDAENAKMGDATIKDLSRREVFA